MSDRIMVAGAGALGSYLAMALSRGGLEVSVLAREPRLSQIRAQGVLFEQRGLRASSPVEAAERVAELPIPDLVLLCTKTTDLAAMLDVLGPLAGAACAFVTVQNGVEGHDEVAARFPDAPVFAARVHGFFELANGVARHVGVEPSLVWGQTAGRPGGDEERIPSVLSRAGIAHAMSGSIMCDLWEKMLLASSIGAVGAALGVKPGMLKDDEQGWNLLSGAMREVQVLATARGIDLPADCTDRALAFVTSFPPTASSSMQRDLEAGMPSEYPALTGAVLRMALEEGLDLPVHQRIDAMIRQRGLLAGV